MNNLTLKEIVKATGFKKKMKHFFATPVVYTYSRTSDTVYAQIPPYYNVCISIEVKDTYFEYIAYAMDEQRGEYELRHRISKAVWDPVVADVIDEPFWKQVRELLASHSINWKY